MRILLALTMIVAMTAGCGAKKKPQTTPASTTESTEKATDDMKDKDSADDADEAAPETKSADPQEGGQ